MSYCILWGIRFARSIWLLSGKSYIITKFTLRNLNGFFYKFRCLRTLLVFSRRDDIQNIKNCLRSALKVILSKCADGNKRIAEYSVETLLELSKGVQGLMGLARYLAQSQKCHQMELEGNDINVDFILSVILEETSQTPNASVWGRLVFLTSLLKRLKDFFIIPKGLENNPSPSPQYKRILMVIDFSFHHLSSSHVHISQLSRNLFVSGAKLTLCHPETYSQLCQLLSNLDPTLQIRMKRKMIASVKDQEDLYILTDKMTSTTSRPTRPKRSLSQSPSRSSSQSPSAQIRKNIRRPTFLPVLKKCQSHKTSFEDVSLALALTKSVQFETPLPLIREIAEANGCQTKLNEEFDDVIGELEWRRQIGKESQKQKVSKLNLETFIILLDGIYFMVY